MDDWSVHLLQLAARERLGRVGRKILLDLPALSQRFACVTELCTPGRRARGVRSCCADLEVTVTVEERAAIVAELPAISLHMEWTDTPEVFAEDTLTRPHRRCVFARMPPEGGLRCGLHEVEDKRGWKRGALKPLPCRLFPLVVVDAEDGRTLLTAIHARTARLAGSRPAAAFACLGGETPTVAESCVGTVAELYGPKVAAAVVDQVRAHVSKA